MAPEEVRCISHGLCKGKPCIYPKCMTEESLRVEEIKAMIEKKAIQMTDFNMNGYPHHIKVQYKENIKLGIRCALSYPELLSKAGYEKIKKTVQKKCPFCNSSDVIMFDSDNDLCQTCQRYFPGT